jgi:hypothetical protein
VAFSALLRLGLDTVSPQILSGLRRVLRRSFARRAIGMSPRQQPPSRRHADEVYADLAGEPHPALTISTEQISPVKQLHDSKNFPIRKNSGSGQD